MVVILSRMDHGKITTVVILSRDRITTPSPYTDIIYFIPNLDL